jgi:hypothetical protein
VCTKSAPLTCPQLLVLDGLASKLSAADLAAIDGRIARLKSGLIGLKIQQPRYNIKAT